MEFTENMKKFPLMDKVAIVIGASRGIGFAIAKEYALAGAKVVISSRKQETLNQAAEKIKKYGAEVLPIAAHIGDSNAIKAMVTQTIRSFDGVDILVNNAATNPHFGPILTATEEEWEKTLSVNLLGYFRTVKLCFESMKKRGGGKVINIASVSALQAQPGLGIYSVSKAGVLMLTKVLALELAEENIQVNAIAPGLIKTHFSQRIWGTPEILDQALKHIPQNRIGKPEDITGIALYLASSASDFTTGSVFIIDGGQLAAGNQRF